MKRLYGDGRKRLHPRMQLTVTKLMIAWALGLALYLWLSHVTGFVNQ